jgi:RNA polymerase sigma factor (TIGR02999 family)
LKTSWRHGIPLAILIATSDVTRILSSIDAGDPQAAEELLPLVYDELRKLAAAKLAQEKPGQTLQATALVHEAYLRLTEGDEPQQWDSRRHFFAAATEAMRRILVENARRKGSLKHGGEYQRHDMNCIDITATERPEELLAVDEALGQLEQTDLAAAQLVKLRYFSGLTIPQAAEVLGVSARTADRLWVYARAWLFRKIGREPGGDVPAEAE